MALQSNLPTKKSDYTIRTVTTQDSPAIVDFIKDFFYTAEPLIEAMNRAENKTQKYEDIPTLNLSEGLSLMAVAPSGEIIGAMLNSELKPAEVNLHQRSTENPRLADIRRLLTIVKAKITELSKSAENNIKEMQIRFVTVHKNWRNKGIGRVLLEHSKELAKERGFKQIRSVCTSGYTAKMFARSGFECVYALHYTDCAKQGIIKYLPQEPHTHIKGMVLRFV